MWMDAISFRSVCCHNTSELCHVDSEKVRSFWIFLAGELWWCSLTGVRRAALWVARIVADERFVGTVTETNQGGRGECCEFALAGYFRCG